MEKKDSKNVKSGGELLVKQVRSVAGRDKRFKAVMNSLGLNGIGQERTLPSNPCVLGMLRRVNCIVEITKK